MLSIALLLAPYQSNLDRKIDYQTRGQDIPEIVRDLGDQNGLKLESSGLCDWPLVLRITGKPIREVMALLAEATDSVWVQKDDRHILTRTQARIDAAARLEAAHRGQRFKAWMTKSFGISEPLREWTDTEIAETIIRNDKEVRKAMANYLKYSQPKDFMTNACETPAKILLVDFCRRVKPEVLGKVPANGLVTFSTSPAGRELPMPVDLGTAIEKYLKTRSRFAARLSPDPIVVDTTRAMSNDRRSLTALNGNPVILVTLQRPGAIANMHADVQVLCNDREDVADIYGHLLEMSPIEEVEPPAKLTGAVKLSNDSIELLKGVGRYAGQLGSVSSPQGGIGLRGPFVPALPETILNKLKDPAKFDPISFFISDWLSATADSLQVDVVASIPDALFQPIANRLKGTSDLAALWKLQTTWQLSMKVDKGILKVGASDIGRQDRYRVDRRALTTLFRGFRPDRLPTLDERATYAMAQPATYSNTNLDYFWMKLVDPNESVFSEWPRPSIYRFWASLLPSQRAANPLTVDPGGLTLPQLRYFDEFMESQFPSSPIYQQESAGTFHVEPFRPDSDHRFREGRLTISHRPYEYYLAKFGNGAVPGLGARELCFLIGVEKAGTLGKTAPLSIRPLMGETIDIRIDTDGGNYTHMPGTLRDFGVAGPEEKLPDLSAGTRERLAKFLAEAEGAKYTPAQTGSTNPPPPR